MKPTKDRKYVKSIAIDFICDLGAAPFTRESLKKLFQIYSNWGITRIYWLCPSKWYEVKMDFHPSANTVKHLQQTYENIGNYLQAAVIAAHDLGMEIFAVYKPFDHASNGTFPYGTEQAGKYGKLDALDGRIYRAAPELVELQNCRIKRKPDRNARYLNRRKIACIKLVSAKRKKSRITKENLTLLVSDDNKHYRKYQGEYTFTENLESNKRVITINGLDIKEKFVVLTTPFKDGEETLVNSLSELIKIYDPKGQIIPFSYSIESRADQVKYLNERWALRKNHVSPDAEKDGYIFNHHGGAIFDGFLETFQWAVDNSRGYLALAKGQEQYLVGSLSPSSRRVQNLWLNEISECLDAGVDGVDLRVVNHDRMFDLENFGFEKPVVKAYQERYGVNILKEPYNITKLLNIRAEHYTQFYQRAKGLISSYNKEMHIHVANMTVSEKRHHRYMGMIWKWQDWLKNDLADAVTLKDMYPEFETKPYYEKVTSMAKKHDLPVFYCPNFNVLSTRQDWFPRLKKLVETSQNDGHSGFILYESSQAVTAQPDGKFKINFPDLPKALI